MEAYRASCGRRAVGLVRRLPWLATLLFEATVSAAFLPAAVAVLLVSIIATVLLRTTGKTAPIFLAASSLARTGAAYGMARPATDIGLIPLYVIVPQITFTCALATALVCWPVRRGRGRRR